MVETERGNAGGGWRELLSREYVGAVSVLAGGVLLYASNVYLTTSLLPTAIGEIGGERLYAWSTTVFLLASVISAVLVSRTLARRGARGSYVIAFVLFGVGSLVSAMAPTMAVLLVGRGLQGLGGGLMSGLGFAVIHSALPARLWVRATAATSAMWGIGNFVGPAIGGLFAQFAAWRFAFLLLVVAVIGLLVLVPRALPASGRSDRVEPVPMISLVLLSGTVALISVAGVVPTGFATVAVTAGALVLVAAFVGYERQARVRVLPDATYRRGSPLKWVYLTVALLIFGVGTETFIPLFGQRLTGLVPLAAGFLGSALSMGWSLAQLSTSGTYAEATTRRLRIAGPAVLAVGLGLFALLAVDGVGWPMALAWALALMIAGAGIGMAFPRLTVAAMSSADATPAAGETDEGAKAAAGVNTVVLITNGFATATAGLLVNVGAPSTVASARLLFAGFAVITAIGIVTAIRSVAGKYAMTEPAEERVRS